jgi:hypothetical protein
MVGQRLSGLEAAEGVRRFVDGRPPTTAIDAIDRRRLPPLTPADTADHPITPLRLANARAFPFEPQRAVRRPANFLCGSRAWPPPSPPAAGMPRDRRGKPPREQPRPARQPFALPAATRSGDRPRRPRLSWPDRAIRGPRAGSSRRLEMLQPRGKAIDARWMTRAPAPWAHYAVRPGRPAPGRRGQRFGHGGLPASAHSAMTVELALTGRAKRTGRGAATSRGAPEMGRAVGS